MKSNYVNHFSASAFDVSKSRSKFFRPNSHKTSFPTGKLIPIYVDEVLPGDTRQITLSSVIRGSTPKYPVMDNAYLDYYAFFTPNRVVMEDWEEFMGENKQDYWSNKTEYLVPHITPPDATADELLHTPIDYMGLFNNLSSDVNPKYTGVTYSALYPRQYVKVWNDWFRDQNTQEPCHLYLDSVDRSASMENASDYVVNAEFGVSLLPVNKFHDYFTSALPQPQKHDPVIIPMAVSAPVSGSTSAVNAWVKDPYSNSISPESVIRLTTYDIQGPNHNPTGSIRSNSNNGDNLFVYTGEGQTDAYPNVYTAMYADVPSVSVMGTADLSKATSITINQLRLAEKTQRFYEIQARGGSRYTEIIQSMFGVYSADSRLQRPEFLGGKRVPIKQAQVTQSFGGDGEQLGATGAFSLTSDISDNLVNKSFTEHGILMICCCVRTDQTYSQGQEKQFARRSLLEYYFPVFARIGEQPILNKELFITNNNSELNNGIFAYQEAYAEYRYKPNRVSGLMRSETPNNLSAWTYANNFANKPVLNAEFMKETDLNVKRSMITQGDEQWIADFYFEEYATRVMPVYSIPSLSDRF